MTHTSHEIREAQPSGVDHYELASQLLAQHEILYSKISENCKLPRQLIPSALTEVVRFLHLCGFSQEILTPSILVDNIWHEFILCTKAYENFCDLNFGRLIHHYPGGSRQDNLQRFEKTLELYHFHFGTPDLRFWEIRASPISPNSSCGSCRTLSGWRN